MALTYLKNEEIGYMEVWEKSPRLPQSIQTKLIPLDADDKLNEVVEHYLRNEDISTLCRAMSVIGFSPIEPLNGIHRDGKLVVFDGNRRLIAAKILLNPDLIKDIKFRIQDDEDTEPLQAFDLITQYRANMSNELLDTLKELPIVEFHSSFYTLESASQQQIMESVDFSDELVCPECGRNEFAEGEEICPDCECSLY